MRNKHRGVPLTRYAVSVWIVLLLGCLSPSSPQIPDFTARLVSGDSLSLRAATRGKVTLLTIWSIFCGPCLKELPALQTIYEHYHDNPRVAILTLALNTEQELYRFSTPDTNADSSDVYRTLFHHAGLTRFTIPTLIGSRWPYELKNGSARLSDTATANHLMRLFSFRGVPTTWIYDQRGRLIVEKQGVGLSAGELAQHRQQILTTIDSLLTVR